MSTLKDTNPKSSFGDTKVPLWLLSPIAKAVWATAQFLGMTKYGAWNWRVSGVRFSTYASAIHRHIDALMSGEEVDPIDGTDHLGAIMASTAIIIDARAAGKLVDDRPPSVSLRETYKSQEALMPQIVERYKHMTPVHMTVKDTQVPVTEAVFSPPTMILPAHALPLTVTTNGSAIVGGPFFTKQTL